MKERRIERRIINLLADLGFKDAQVIRRCSVAPGFGIVDLVVLPKSVRYKLVLIEAKRSVAPDAVGKVVGQLLSYRAALATMRSDGLKLMGTYCTENDSHARGARRKSLQAIAGVRPAKEAWRLFQKGKPVRDRAIGLMIALEAEPSLELKSLLEFLDETYGLDIGVISALGGRRFKLWPPKLHRALRSAIGRPPRGIGASS